MRLFAAPAGRTQGETPPIAMSSDRTLTSRYEWKYFVPHSLLPAIRAMARPFVRPDEHARRWPGYRYPVMSLYLDGEGLELYRTTVEGHLNRFKLRVRAYDEDPESPVFLEIKKRSNVVVRKTRAQIARRAALGLLGGEHEAHQATSGEAEFVTRMREVHARPTVRVRYMREAYESRVGDPVRLTFDTDVQHCVTRGADLGFGAPEDWTTTPTEGAIVELKFSDRCPGWATAIIDRLEMVRESIPKYVLSLDRALERGSLDPRAGLPARGRARA